MCENIKPRLPKIRVSVIAPSFCLNPSGALLDMALNVLRPSYNNLTFDLFIINTNAVCSSFIHPVCNSAQKSKLEYF